MPQSHHTSRCWLCDHATWFFPVWTWIVVLLTGSFMLGLLRPEVMTGWLSLMGLVLILLGFCIAVLIEENHRDRARAATANSATPPPTLTPPRPLRRSS
jgi:hypothetical protein